MDYQARGYIGAAVTRLEQRIDDSVSDIQSELNDVERELTETRQLSELILTRVDEILNRLKHPHHPAHDEHRCGCGTYPCDCGEH